MTDWRGASITVEATVRDAMTKIDSQSLQIALVVDVDDRLLGTVTDGDIRRGLLRGVDFNAPATEIMERDPITLDPGIGSAEALLLMQAKQIRQIPRVDGERRIVGLEVLDQLLGPVQSDVWVVLMAGGLGSRLRPLTAETPKPLLPVAGRPLLQIILESFVQQGFRRFFMAINYKGTMFREHFGDGSRWGVDIDYLEESERLGTAGALRLLPEDPPGPMIVMNGDLLTAVEYRHLLDFHHAQGADATMCVRDYSLQVPYGVASIEGHNLIGISEKPRHHFFVNAGIYVLDPEVLQALPDDGPCDMPQLFETLIGQGREVAAFPIREYWLDIGHFDDLEQAQGDFPKVFG